MQQTKQLWIIKDGMEKMKENLKDIKEIKMPTQDEMNRMINQKMDVFFKLTTGDLLDFFDLANSIITNGRIFITKNHLILEVKDKFKNRIKNFDIMTPEEFNDFVAKKNPKAKIEKKEVNYVG